MSNLDFTSAITQNEENVLVDIEVTPNSKKFQFGEFNSWRNCFEIKIKEIPQKGKANKEIIKQLSKLFDVKVDIVKGLKSSQKTIIFYNSSKEDIIAKIKNL